MGQEWQFQILIEPNKNKFNKVTDILSKMDIPQGQFKEPVWDEDKEDNSIQITGSTHGGYDYGEYFIGQLSSKLKGLIKSGDVAVWYGDYPQEFVDLNTGKNKLKAVV